MQVEHFRKFCQESVKSQTMTGCQTDSVFSRKFQKNSRTYLAEIGWKNGRSVGCLKNALSPPSRKCPSSTARGRAQGARPEHGHPRNAQARGPAHRDRGPRWLLRCQILARSCQSETAADERQALFRIVAFSTWIVARGISASSASL